MDAGRIVELGAHDDLVARGGTYGRLWHSWQSQQAPAPDGASPRGGPPPAGASTSPLP